MNNITITHELCTEDRARLDRLGDLLERRIKQAEHIMRHSEGYEPEPVDLDAVQQKLAETMARANAPTEAPKNAQEEAEASTLTTTPPNEEKPTAEEIAPTEETKPTVTQAQLQQKITQLAAANNGAKKAQVRGIVKKYAEKVSDLPEDKYSEIWAELIALEKEA